MAKMTKLELHDMLNEQLGILAKLAADPAPMVPSWRIKFDCAVAFCVRILKHLPIEESPQLEEKNYRPALEGIAQHLMTLFTPILGDDHDVWANVCVTAAENAIEDVCRDNNIRLPKQE